MEDSRDVDLTDAVTPHADVGVSSERNAEFLEVAGDSEEVDAVYDGNGEGHEQEKEERHKEQEWRQER